MSYSYHRLSSWRERDTAGSSNEQKQYNTIDLTNTVEYSKGYKPVTATVIQSNITNSKLYHDNLPSMVLVDSVGTELTVTNDKLPSGNYTIQEYIDNWNARFSSHANADVNTVSMSYVTYDNTAYDNVTNPLQGWSAWSDWYRDNRKFHVLTLTSTAELYLKWSSVADVTNVTDDSVKKNMALVFPFIHYETLYEWRYNGMLHPVDATMHVVFDLRTSPKMLVHDTVWDNTVLILNGDGVTLRDEFMSYIDVNHGYSSMGYGNTIPLSPGTKKLTLRWIPTSKMLLTDTNTGVFPDYSDDLLFDLLGYLCPSHEVVIRVEWR